MAADAPSPVHARIAPGMRGLLTVLAVVGGMLIVNPAPASADMHADQSVAALENQIDTEWQALEPTIEQYDTVNANYQTQQGKVDKLEKSIQPLQLQVSLAEARIGSISAQLYESGPNSGLALLLNTASAADSLDLLATVNQMASNRQAEISSTIKLEAKYEAQEKPIAALAASLNAQRTALAAQKRTIGDAIAKLDALRVKVWGSTVAPGATRPVACPQVYHGDAGSRAAAYACGKIGKRYVWDAAGPNSFDCSGLTMVAWQQEGVYLPHNAYAQKHAIRPVYGAANLQPGDLVFYYSNVHHVGIYVGKGWIVNAPNSGDVVRMAKYNKFPVNSFGRP